MRLALIVQELILLRQAGSPDVLVLEALSVVLELSSQFERSLLVPKNRPKRADREQGLEIRHDRYQAEGRVSSKSALQITMSE